MAKLRSKRLSAEEKKEKLLLGLVDVRERILKQASRFSPEMEKAQFVGTWDIRDLLSHLSGWDITNLEAAKEILDEKVPRFYQNYDRDWKSYNASLVGEYKREDLLEQLSLVKDTHDELIRFLEILPAPMIFKDWGIRNKGYKVIISRLLEVEREDEEVHLNQIVEYLNSYPSLD
jgi:hypothetical protein